MLSLPLTPERFEESQTALDEIGGVENKDYADEDARTVAKQFADDIVRGPFAQGASRVIEPAEEHGCDHVYITGRRRSPTGRAMFGDTTQHSSSTAPASSPSARTDGAEPPRCGSLAGTEDTVELIDGDSQHSTV